MAAGEPTRQQITRWRKYLANERAEAAVVPASLGGLDQDHLAKLMAGAASERLKLQKAVAKR